MMKEVDLSLSVSNPQPNINGLQKLGLGLVGLSLLCIVLAFSNQTTISSSSLLGIFLSTLSVGSLIYSWQQYKGKHEGIKNDGVFFKSISNKGVLGWLLGVVITGFYVILYWFPSLLGLHEGANSGLVKMFDPLSYFLKGSAASQWFVYGTLYTMAIILLGIKFLYKYRHNKYQLVRTSSVIFFQLGFAFLIPELLEGLHSGDGYFAKDMKNMWPLNYYFFEDWHLDNMLKGGNLGLFMLILGIAMIFIISPILTYFYGKRWYCSWVCGCGGLAETAGDPFRQNSDKSNEAWQIERIVIHSILVFILITTVLVLYTYFTGKDLEFTTNKYLVYGILTGLGLLLYGLQRKFFSFVPPTRIRILIPALIILAIAGFEWKYLGDGAALRFSTYELRSWYGFFVGAAFSGVVGVGFYPILGSRVWCRFGCPMAAILGMQQRFFSRFRITTNGGQCISCGNCSTYCEMGIDVRAYAQKGQNIVRSSCVGCGICAAVCPRGVLRLENGKEVSDRTEIKPVQVTEEGINLLR